MLESRDESVNMEPVFWTQGEEAGGVHSWEPLFLERTGGAGSGKVFGLGLGKGTK